jgi:hypothetical protein
MFGKKKSFLSRVLCGAAEAVKSARQSSSIAEELELAAARKVLEIARERVKLAEAALKAKRKQLAAKS